MSAGPSRLSNGSSSSQVHKKRRRYNNLEEVFEKQDAQETKRLSAGFRDLTTRADGLKADVGNRSLKDIRKTMRAGEVLFEQTRSTSVALLDARLMHSMMETAVARARKMRTDTSAFDVDEFVIKLKSMLGLDNFDREDASPDPEEDELEDSQEAQNRRRRYRKGALGDWESVGWTAANHTRRVPGVEFMYGPLAVEHTKRATQRRQQRAPVEPETRPEEVHNRQRAPGEAPPPDDMVNNVFTVFKVLQKADKGDGVNFLQLVVNPNDYGQTVENIFYASFLIKDGKAGIQVDDDGQIIIRNEAQADLNENGDLAKNQAVIEFSMEDWREARSLLNLTVPMIPTREYGITARPRVGTWYT